ncbi:hypothetical protein TNCV_983091 [Trichonephila clavipes]|nr:hypothetical protein TNCV_983091 [Trichonephila clavipes]
MNFTIERLFYEENREMIKVLGKISLDRKIRNIEPAGWFGLVRHRPPSPKVANSTLDKSMVFQDAENRQRPCRITIRHEKNPLSACLA